MQHFSLQGTTKLKIRSTCQPFINTSTQVTLGNFFSLLLFLFFFFFVCLCSQQSAFLPRNICYFVTPPRRMICSWFTPLDAVMQVKIKDFTEQCNYYDLSNTELQQSVQDKPLRSWLGTSGHPARALLLCWWQWACFIRELGSLMIVRFSSTKDLWAKAVH